MYFSSNLKIIPNDIKYYSLFTPGKPSLKKVEQVL